MIENNKKFVFQNGCTNYLGIKVNDNIYVYPESAHDKFSYGRQLKNKLNENWDLDNFQEWELKEWSRLFDLIGNEYIMCYIEDIIKINNVSDIYINDILSEIGQYNN